MRGLLSLGVGALLALGLASTAGAVTVLPMYTDTVASNGTVGIWPTYPANTTHYVFTAATSGDIIAYYTGSSASDAEWLGLVVGASLTDTGFHGLENHDPMNPSITTPLGASFDLGHVNAGETYVFYIQDLNVGRSTQKFFSNYTLNHDGVGGSLAEHVYSTSFTAGSGINNVSTGGASPSIFTVPEGVYTYLGFEDLPATDHFADYNYHDETFLFRLVSDPAPPTHDPVGGIPEPATWALTLLGFAALGGGVRRARATGLATA